MTFDLPWMPSACRPNGAKGSWRKKHTATSAYKADCAILCRAAGLRKMDGDVRPHLTLVFRQPDRRRADLDNHLAAFKAGVDAISDAIGVDDHFFSFSILRGEPVRGGAVEVTITEA